MSGITTYTRKDLFDFLRLTHPCWWGRMKEADFLERVFKISERSSHDRRAGDMHGDVSLHRDHFLDWEDGWVYDDPRLDLMGCSEGDLLRFLSEMVHPLVMDSDKAENLVNEINNFLQRDGYRLEVTSVISGKKIYSGSTAAVSLAVGTDDAKRIADDLASDHVMGQITRMRASINDDPALAIGSAKEFVESIAKGILRQRGIAVAPTETFQRVVNLARKELDLTVTAEMPNSWKGMISALSTIIQSIGDIRGKMGTGHGAAPETPKPSVEVARLAVGMAIALGVYLYETHTNTRSSNSASNMTS